ncbi:MAG: aminotransferase class V-fold PLP-dependent enzyme [Verrucomicrobiales bacterium]|nr:aminotransferase class V-fold PLP-dependent enzyme [Verrucomicrobiales bacterium]
MPIPLYLDAARMGLMTPSAQLALRDFVRFAGETCCTLYFEHFWKDGAVSWDRALHARFPGLQIWRGIAELKDQLRKAAGAEAKCPLYIAGRSASLVNRAIRALFQKCRRVLVSDLTWPAYARIIRHAAATSGRHIARVSIRNAILACKASSEEIFDKIVRHFCNFGCDGAFLPEVSHDGIRLPISILAEAIRERSPKAMIVIDGAQSFAHIPIERSLPASDCYIMGCHKWLGTHLPMGIAFCPRVTTSSDIGRNLDESTDPLLEFVNSLESRSQKRFGETVNLTPLLACRGALADFGDVTREFAIRRGNARLVCGHTGSLWSHMLPQEAFRTGIILMRVLGLDLGADKLRSTFGSNGVTLSAYVGGTIRLSMPKQLMSHKDLDLLAKAVRAVGAHARSLPATTDIVHESCYDPACQNA